MTRSWNHRVAAPLVLVVLTATAAAQEGSARVPLLLPLPAPASAQASSSGASAVPPRAPGTSAQLCLDSIRDQANSNVCLGASSSPLLGALYPLGVELNIDPAGNVGIGTLTPDAKLHVAGDLAVEGGMAIGNNTGTATGSVIFDVSQRVTDFSSASQWQLRFSNLAVDPAIDLTGPDETFLFGNTEFTHVPAANSRNLRYLVGSYHGAYTLGSGNIELMSGAGTTATALGTSTIDLQIGAFVASDARQSSIIQDNRGLQVKCGHDGVAGEIVANHGIYLESPHALQPLQNNYGIFLADQDFGQNDSFAVYSEGGTVYIAGDVGIGTNTPGYKLQVGEPGDGTEARANAWNLLSSREYKRDIRPTSADERAAILAAIVDTDVVRYAYEGDPDGEEHLGVIAEDSPEDILSKDRGAVSLGDWSAFLMAGMQAQQREIEQLRSELEELRGALENTRER